MIRRREFRIPSSDGKSELHTVLWEPDGEVKQLLDFTRDDGTHPSV